MSSDQEARIRCGRLLADRLEKIQEHLIEAYAEAVPQEIAAAAKLHRDRLVDSLPRMLANLRDLLLYGESAANVRQSTQLGIEHGSARAAHSRYSLSDLLVEYRILSRILFQHLRASGHIGHECEDLISDALLRGIGNAATEFTRVRSGAEERYKQEREKLLEELRDSYEFLQAVIANLPVGVSIAEAPSGNALFYNAEVERLLGHPVSGRKNFKEYASYGAIHQDGSPYKPEEYPTIRALFRGELVRGEEMRYRRPDGAERVFILSSTPVRAPDGTTRAAVTTIHDITELKNAESRAKESVAMLEQERDLREQFVSALWHDLRTPLTAARMSAQMIFRNPGAADVNRKLSGRVIENMDRMDHMLRDLLDATRIRTGMALPVNPGECELGSTITSVLHELATLHGDRFIFSCEKEIRGYWDCGGLTRILENLCTNAVKYGSRDSPVKIRCGERNGEVLLSVHNEGNPIPPEDQKNLFEPFHRSQGAQFGAHGGWGIGLALVRALTDAHGGRVTLESAEGLGTTFTVYLPKDARSISAGEKKSA